MGSLMAGWQTNPLNAKEALKRSNSSVTKEEVERFWRHKEEIMEKQLRETQRRANQSRSLAVPASPASDSGCESAPSSSGSIFESPPITPTTPSTIAAQESASAKSPGWWHKTYWAFLNEPPILEEKQNRYVAQYDLTGPLKQDSDASTTSNIYVRHEKHSDLSRAAKCAT